MLREAPVKLQLRKGGAGNYEWRNEREWPLKRTKWTPLFISSENLVSAPGKKSAVIAYEPGGTSRSGMPLGSLSASVTAPGSQSGASFFTKPFPRDTELTGPVKLVLWVSSTTRDMDIFATVRNIDADGNGTVPHQRVYQLIRQPRPITDRTFEITFLDAGHVLDFMNKACEYLDLVGWEEAGAILPSLVRGLKLAV